MPLKSAIVLLILLAVPVSAKTYRIPEEEPIARISIPNNWKTEYRGEYLDSTLPNGAGHVLVLPVEGQKPAESMLETMRYIRRHGTVKVDAHSEKRDVTRAGERTVRTHSWDATENDQSLKIRCHIISDLNGKRLLVTYWGPVAGEEKHMKDLRQVLESIQTP